MPTYGDKAEPGIVTTVESATNVSGGGDAPSDLGIVGQAYLSQGNADPNTVYEITRVSDARDLFGPETESLLTQGIVDAFREGAFPVYAVAPEEVDATDDIGSVSSTSGTLADGPVTEVAEDITFTVDGSEATVNVVYDDPSTYSPEAGEVYLNPVSGAFETSVAPSTGDSVDYVHYDYVSANEALADGAGSTVDFFVPLSERSNVVQNAQTVVSDMASLNDFALALVGPEASYIDPGSFTNPFDDSRMQVLGTTRFEDGSSALAAFAGLRAFLGLDATPIGQRLTVDKSLAQSLTRQERSDLIEANVVPMVDDSTGARVVDDPVSVSDSNDEEANIKYGFTRLVVDYVIEITRTTEKPFIGRLNRPEVLNTLEDLIDQELKGMENANAVVSYDVEIRKEDAVTASMELNVEVAEPIRFIENSITVGTQA